MFRHSISSSGVALKLKVTTAVLKINKVRLQPSGSTVETNVRPYFFGRFGTCLNDDAKVRNLWYCNRDP